MYFTGEDGARHDVYGSAAYADYSRRPPQAGAEAASGRQPDRAARRCARFGRMATREIEEVCGLKGPRAEAELWRLALGVRGQADAAC